MKKTGQLLKEAREKQGVSLNAVSAATKISVKVLESIETGDLSTLPPKTFVRGFVQTYAMYLKLDPKQILETFQEEVGTTRYNPVYDQVDPVTGATIPGSGKEEAPTKARETVMLSQKPNTGLTKWLFAGLALFLFVAIYFVSQTVQKYKKESEVSDLPPEISSEEILPEATPETLPVASPGTSTEGEVSPTPEGSATPQPSDTPKASATPTASASPSPSPSPQASASPTPSPSPSPAPATSKQDVTIEALDTVKIDFSIDGGDLQSVSLEPEQKRKFSAKSSFTANVSDGGAINIIHNGKDKGVPGNLGQPIQLSFPPKE